MSKASTTGKGSRFGTVIWWVGVLATAVLIATLVQGLDVKDRASLQPHLFLALAAVLMMLFSHLWIQIYLRVLGREMRNHQQEAGPGESEDLSEEDPSSMGLSWGIAAVVLVFSSFGLGPLGLIGKVSLAVHGWVGLLALGVQVASLWIERRNLGSTGQALRRLYAAE